MFSTNETTGGNGTTDPGHMTNIQVLRPCIFCSGSHYNDECGEYSTLAERKRRLNQQGRCFVCLRLGYVSKQCPNLHKRACHHCGKRDGHNRCLCPEKFSGQNAESFLVSKPGDETSGGVDQSSAESSHEPPPQQSNETKLIQSLKRCYYKLQLCPFRVKVVRWPMLECCWIVLAREPL